MFHIYLARALASIGCQVLVASSIQLGQGTTWMLDVQSNATGHMAQRFPGCIVRLEVSKLLRRGLGVLLNGRYIRDRSSDQGWRAWRSWSFSDLYGVVSQLNPSWNIPTFPNYRGKAITTAYPMKAPVSNFKKLCSKGVVWSSCCGAPEQKSNSHDSARIHERK